MGVMSIATTRDVEPMMAAFFSPIFIGSVILLRVSPLTS